MNDTQSYLGRLRELLSLTEDLQKASAAKDWEAIVATLELRQALMDEVDAMPVESLRLAIAEAQEAASLVAAISAADRAVAGAAEAALLEAKGELQGMKEVTATVSAYRRSTRTHPEMIQSRFVDRHK